MSTLYTRDGEDFFELPGRTVNTFTSGLVRIDSTYLVKTSNIQTVKDSNFKVGSPIYGNDEYPAVDGLYLYPEAQERRRETGMTEIIASYYGRTRTDLPPPIIKESIGIITLNESVLLEVSFNKLFFEFVVPVEEVVSFRDTYSFSTPLAEPNFVNLIGAASKEPASFTKSSFSKLSVFTDFYNIVTPFGTLLFNYPKPRILVTGQQNYGNFVELQVTFNRF